MVEAWNLQSNREAAILFIVEDVTYNICDQVSLSEIDQIVHLQNFVCLQRFHEFYIRREYPNVKVIRKTLTEVHQFGKLGKNKELIV